MNNTKKMTTTGLLCTLAYVVMLTKYVFPPLFSAFPFLQYDPKDVIIVIGGYIYGPLTAFVISTIVSLIEMLTSSSTHIIGCFMNIAASCAFACTAAAVYSKYRSIKGGMVSLVIGSACAVGMMMVLNYFVTPLYTGMPREAVADLLIPAILPFNIIKCTLNSALVLLIYKPMTRALRRGGLLESTNSYSARNANVAVALSAIFMILICMTALWIVNR